MDESTLQISHELQDVIEKAGVKISGTYYQDGRYFTELEWYSDLGEDVVVTIWHDNTDESFIAELEDYYNDFDPEEHAAMWWEAKDRVSNVPQSLRALLKDAQDIENTIWELLNKMKETKEEGAE